MSMDPESRADQRSVPNLLSDLVHQITTLFRTESSLLKAELSENVNKLGTGAMEVAAGAICLLVALIVLVQALVIALSGWLGPTWAALLVGIALAAIGAILAKRGSTNLSPSGLAPDRTTRQVREDINLAKEEVR